MYNILCILIDRNNGEFSGETCIDKNNLATDVDDSLLEVRVLLDRSIVPLSVFAAKGKRLRHESVLVKRSCFLPRFFI